jgi:hypothetical protein
MNVLWNAEPFGFGPAAAIAQIAARLRGDCEQSTYLGDSHTLDLQTADVYDDVIDCAQIEDLDLWLSAAAADYDLFVTAMDFTLARRARAAGLRVVIYDALAWYWPRLAPDCDLYLAQDFIGVKRRLEQTASLPPTMIVPPLTKRRRYEEPTSGPLVSFGGITNPFWTDAVGDAYVASMARALAGVPGLEAIGAKRYTTLVDLPYRCVTPQESEQLFAAAAVVGATPGLGNLYDIAAVDKPFVPLPPVNDSQGRQVTLLTKVGYVPSVLDWHHFLPITPIDYLAPQAQVLDTIAQACLALASDSRAQARLAVELELRFRRAAEDGVCRLRPLLEDYGSDGLEEVCARILAFGREDVAPAGLVLALRAEEAELLDFHGYTALGDWELNEDGTSTLALEQDGQAVSARRQPRRSSAIAVTDADVVALRAHGLTHFAHTTRPENLIAILETGALLPGERLRGERPEGVLYGDPLGPHNRVVGQLVSWDGDTEQLLELTGQRAPVLLLELESLIGQRVFLNRGYPCAYQVDFTTSDGFFTPSLALEPAIAQLSDELRQDHEVVITTDRLELALAAVVVTRDLADAFPTERAAELMASLGATVVWAEALSPSPYLCQFTPYSANSLAIATAALAAGASERAGRHLLARELPDLARLVDSHQTDIKEISARVNRAAPGRD